MYEYKTTSAQWEEAYFSRASDNLYDERGEWVPAHIPDPVVPDGDGWELVGTSAIPAVWSADEREQGRLFWTWRRPKTIVKKKKSKKDRSPNDCTGKIVLRGLQVSAGGSSVHFCRSMSGKCRFLTYRNEKPRCRLFNVSLYKTGSETHHVEKRLPQCLKADQEYQDD